MTRASKRKTPKRPPKQTGRTLRGRMARIRRELAALGAGGAGNGNGDAELFQSALEQLDALGDEIAEATDRMMTACEEIQESADAQ